MNSPRAFQRHLVKALAAGALLAAAALPMAIATAAGAADSVTSVTFNTANGGGTTNAAYFGSGASGTFDIVGAFAGDGGNTTVTTSAAGVTFSGVTNTTTTDITGNFATTSATVPGTYTITVTDNAGTATSAQGAANGGFTVYGDPSITSLSVASGSDTPAFPVIATTATGSGFVGTPAISFTSTVDGTSIGPVVVTATAGTESNTSISPVSTVGLTVKLQNPTDLAAATPGTYVLTVINPDGGVFTSGPIFTVIGDEITTLSPSALAIPAAGSTTSTVTINGGGFQSGATVTIGVCAGVTSLTPTATVSSASTITIPLTVASGSAPTRCDVTVTNSAVGDNGASYIATGALGVGEASDLAPAITASSLSAAAAIVAGAPSTTITYTGTGFSSFSLPGVSTFGAANTADPNALVSGPCISNSAGTSLTCSIVANSGVYAGAHTGVVGNDGVLGTLASAFTIDGPAIASAAPAALAQGSAIGTVVALTGTGFNNTSALTVAGIIGGTGLGGALQFSSATLENLVVTTSPTTVGTAKFSLQTTDAYGATELSAPFSLPVDAAPTVTSTSYVTGTSGVGVGASAQTITIAGSGFQTGATLTGFTNASAVADANVTAKVVSVSTFGTSLTATVAIATGDTNTIDGFTVTNPDGGHASAAAVAPAGLVIDAAPTISAVSPSTATPSATNAFTITGTGFRTGAVVTASSDGTCGSATLASSTSITVSCTLGAEGTTAVTLAVTNLDGGSATSATVLPAATITPPKPKFHVSAVHGHAVHGKTVTLTISGTGFYGAPKVTSSAKGVKAVVSHDTGKVLTVVVTTPANVTGTHTFTVRNPNGKTGKVNYSTK